MEKGRELKAFNELRVIQNAQFHNPKKTFKRYQENNEMFDKMMSEPGYMEDFMSSMFKFIYENLKNKGNEK